MKLTRNFYPQWGGLNAFSSTFDELALKLNRLDSLATALQGYTTPHLAADAYEDKNHYQLRFEVPGLKKGEVKVEAEGNTIRVKAEGGSEKAEHNYNVGHTLVLPDNVNTDDVEAKLENGLLTIKVAKNEENKPKTIEIH